MRAQLNHPHALLTPVISLLAAVCCACPVAAQETLWSARFSTSASAYARSEAVDATGAIYVTGTVTVSSSRLDYETVKYGPNGARLWEKRYDDPVNGYDDAEAIALCPSGGVYVSGVALTSSGYTYLTIHYSAGGQEAWKQFYPVPNGSGAHVSGIAVDSSGSVVVSGSAPSLGPGSAFATVKYAPDGAQLWSRVYSGAAQNIASSLGVDAADNIFVGGTLSDGSTFRMAVVKYDPSGSLLWVRRFDGHGRGSNAAALAVAPDGGVALAGSAVVLGAAEQYAVVAYDANGTERWHHYAGSPSGLSIAQAAIYDSGDGLYVAGITAASPQSSFDYATVRFNQDGSRAWLRTEAGPGNADWMSAQLAVDSSSNAVLAGTVDTASGSQPDIYGYLAAQYSPDGQRIMARHYDPESGTGSVAGVAVDGSGNIVITGTAYCPAYNVYGYLTVKYAP